MSDAAGGAAGVRGRSGWAGPLNPFADAGGTLLTVVPAGDGRSRMAIVGYVLPPEPSFRSSRAGAADTATGATAGGPPSDLVVDCAGRRVLLNGRDLGLLFQEFELLEFLAAHPYRVFTREQILERAWSGEQTAAATRTVDVHVHRVRRKLGPAYARYLVTVRRVGYMFRPPPPAAGLRGAAR